MSTTTLDAAGPGKAASRAVKSLNPRQKVTVSGTFAFDNSYPTGGEPLTDITANFRETLHIFMEQPILVGAQTGKFLRVSGSGSTWVAQLYTNASPFAEVANASDQSLVTGLHFIAEGYV